MANPLGHIAGAYLPADLYVRFQRLRRKDVVFICVLTSTVSPSR